MKTIVNNEKFDSLHACLLKEIVGAIKEALEAEGASGDWLKKMTEVISFRVCEIIDAGCEMKCGDDYMAPFIAFYDQGGESEDILINDDGSCLHELVHFASEQIFNS